MLGSSNYLCPDTSTLSSAPAHQNHQSTPMYTLYMRRNAQVASVERSRVTLLWVTSRCIPRVGRCGIPRVISLRYLIQTYDSPLSMAICVVRCAGLARGAIRSFTHAVKDPTALRA